jgi:four helix bundle protein
MRILSLRAQINHFCEKVKLLEKESSWYRVNVEYKEPSYAQSYGRARKVQKTKGHMQDKNSSNLENLNVYLKARILAISCLKYFNSLKFDRRNEFLIQQILRAVTSVGANIAEGCGRHYKNSYRQFLSIARGSCFEVEYWLEVAIELKKYNNGILEDFKTANMELIKILTTMMKNLERKVQ